MLRSVLDLLQTYLLFTCYTDTEISSFRAVFPVLRTGTLLELGKAQGHSEYIPTYLNPEILKKNVSGRIWTGVLWNGSAAL